MEVVHHYDHKKRQHYLLENRYSLKLKPTLLYVGALEKQKDWRAQPHSHPFLEVLFITSGSGRAVINGVSYSLQCGDLLVYNANVQHYEESAPADPMAVRFAAYDTLEITNLPPNWLLPEDYGVQFASGEMYDIFYRTFDILLREFEGKERFFAEIVHHVSRALLIYLFRLVNKTKSAAELLSPNQTMEEVLTYIHAHYAEEVTLEQVAKECCVNKYYLAHLFTRTQGISLGRYLLCTRISEAKRLLANSTMPVCDIAQAVGFRDNSYFGRVFRKEAGMTPLAYRKQAKTTEE